ncbi:hypothetical protein F8M41_005610 [Gigaspora margarita]|uniref:Uncharacterized protein n=1 Tax=Gigaspora margarita TaxID=4874 RepID=A0A8H3X9F5_GIGMA|nr:hypothetical protein F8M41_005610 [Gigaspora margarita]
MDDMETLNVSTSDIESSDSLSVSDKMLDVSFLDINRGLIINARETLFSDLSAYELESQPEINPLKSVQFRIKMVCLWKNRILSY